MNLNLSQLKEKIKNNPYYYYYYNWRNKKIKKYQKFYSQFIPPQSIAYDIGANIGDRTESLTRICKIVIAVEPLPFIIKKLKSRFKYNKKIIIEPFAIGEKESITDMYVSNIHTMSTLSADFIKNVYDKWSAPPIYQHTIKVKTVTIDQLIQKYSIPYFIKVDVEGYELEVLNGLTHSIPYIAFEYNPTNIEKAIQCIERLIKINSHYKFNIALEDTAEFHLSIFVSSDKMIDLLRKNIHQGKFGDIYASSIL